MSLSSRFYSSLLFIAVFIVYTVALRYPSVVRRGPSNYLLAVKSESVLSSSSIKKTIVDGFQKWKGLSDAALLGYVDSSSHSRRELALDVAYNRCQQVTRAFSKTFYMGSSLMPPASRKYVWAIYSWCRRTDDLVDSPRALADQDNLLRDLAEWEKRLEDIWNGTPLDLYDLALADTVRKYPTLDIQPFKDMIQGMVMDVPGLGKDRYQTFDDLYLYCYRVAGTVGLMTLPVLGSLQNVMPPEIAEPAVALGVALQLTNILRDVGEDLRRGRIYLPLEELEAFGLSEQDIAAGQVTPKYIRFMKFQIERARAYYRSASKGIAVLQKSARFPVQASLELYGKILEVIERNGYDNFQKRAFTTKSEKLAILPRAFMRSQAATLVSL